jgi:biopolymer transport protein ExbD
MMTKRRKGIPQIHGNSVNVTPLIDVVMCLIIFFMLVAKIGISTGAKPMDLPYSYLGKTIDDLGNTLTVNILPMGDLNAIKHPAPGERAMLPTEMQVTALVDNVDRDLPIKAIADGAVTYPLREVMREMKGRYGEQFKVIIRADSDLPFHLIEPVLIECGNAGVQNYAYSTQNLKGGEATANQ